MTPLQQIKAAQAELNDIKCQLETVQKRLERAAIEMEKPDSFPSFDEVWNSFEVKEYLDKCTARLVYIYLSVALGKAGGDETKS